MSDLPDEKPMIRDRAIRRANQCLQSYHTFLQCLEMASYKQEDSRLLGGNEHEWAGKLPELYRIVSSMTSKV